MNNEREYISTLIDDEGELLSEPEIDRVINDKSNRDVWSRYQLIGDVLREDTGHIETPMALADRVREEIEKEPIVFAPKVVPDSKPKSERKIVQPLVGMAIAASVAALAVLGVQQMRPNDISPTNAQNLPVASLNAAEEVMQRVATTAPAADPNNDYASEPMWLETEHATEQLMQQRRLNSYLVNFNEQRSSLGMPGVNPYVRIIGFESE